MSKRPKLEDIKASENQPSKSEKIRRTAQPGNVPFPRAVAYHTDLSNPAKLVAMWLYDHLKPGTNIATGSQDTIAEEMSLGKRTVIYALNELWEKHIIMQTEKNNKTGGGYYLCYQMRIFPNDQPRKQKPIHTKQQKHTYKTRKTKKSASNPKPDCQLCYGTGWHILENRQGAKPCACKTVYV
jgi:hypothetical protein